jgi:surfactin synthase thioesterase subunit
MRATATDHGVVPLLCLPFAGAGASFYRPWRRLDVATIEVHPLQLPGREERLAEAPYVDVETAVASLLPSVLEVARRYPVALFGHSLGAVLAYELARKAVEHGQDLVLHLIVSGSPVPWDGRRERASECNDDEFVKRVEEFAGYCHPALRISELRELLLPGLRADVQMHEDYSPGSATRLPVPITSLRGRDDHLVSTERACRWREATSLRFDAVELPGGHMYLTEDPLSLLELISDRLTRDTAEAYDAAAS